MCERQFDKEDLYLLYRSNNSLTIFCCYSLVVPFMTQISYASTAAELSNKKKYPRFFRTCASDVNQAEALAELVTHFNWRRVSTGLSLKASHAIVESTLLLNFALACLLQVLTWIWMLVH